MCFLAIATVVRWETKFSQNQQALPLLPGKTLASVPWRCPMHNHCCLPTVLCFRLLYCKQYSQCSLSVLSFLFVLLSSKCRAIRVVAGIDLTAL